MNEKISVIIPIYKVEKYLNRCIESVVNQTYTNLEIILVDDASPDGCPEICEKWKRKDERIKVLHKENGGLSDARNTGMRIATGEYITFLDSDDWLHKDTLEIFGHFLKLYDADIVECEALLVNETIQDKLIDKESIKITEFNKKSSMKALVYEKPLKQTVWNKLYKRSLIAENEFENGKYHEDEFWTYQIFDKAEKILFLDIQLYYYFQRSDSIMGQEFSLKRLNAIEGRYRRLQYLEGKYPELEAYTKENIIFLMMYYGQQALKASRNVKKTFFDEIENYLKEIDITAKNEQEYSFFHKLWIKGSKKNIYLTCVIRNLLKIGIR